MYAGAVAVALLAEQAIDFMSQYRPPLRGDWVCELSQADELQQATGLLKIGYVLVGLYVPVGVTNDPLLSNGL